MSELFQRQVIFAHAGANGKNIIDVSGVAGLMVMIAPEQHFCRVAANGGNGVAERPYLAAFTIFPVWHVRSRDIKIIFLLGSCLAEPFMIGFKARYANEKQVCNSFKNF